jgi:uncharacterized protein (UPF0332 family)
MNADRLLEKAMRAVNSARRLVEDGAYDDAVSRAYYGMFNAARAALELVDAPFELENVSTHGTIIGAFGKHLVKEGLVGRELGIALSGAAALRKSADYADREVSAQAARAVTDDAVQFAETIWGLAEEKSLEHLRRVAEEAGLTLGKTNEAHGEYLGQLLGSTQYHALQSVGRGEAVVHGLCPDHALASIAQGQTVRVRYKASIAEVSVVPGRDSSRGHER